MKDEELEAKLIETINGTTDIPFSRPSLGQEEIDAVSKVLRSGWLAAGPEVEAFEREFAQYVGVKYAIFTNSCTSALKMAYNILKELGYTGIVYPQNTFVATYSAAAELGLDICPKGGYDGINQGEKWQHSQNTHALNAMRCSKTPTTVIDGSSVQSSVTERAEKGLASPHRQSSSRERGTAQEPSSKRQDTTQIAERDYIGLLTSGLSGITAKQMSAMSVDQLKELVGQTKTTNIQKNVINGRNYAPSATSNTTRNIIANINVHYGSVKDTTPCIIEDSAHRIEPSDHLVGLIRCYSFYVTKNMTTGAGGMFVTNNKEIYEKAREYWRDGLSTSTKDRLNGNKSWWSYNVLTLVSGYDGNDLAASIGRAQLKKLPQFTAKRNEIVKRYNQAFGASWTGNHLYPYFVKTKEEVGELIEYLKEGGIQAGYHYPGGDWLGVSLPLYPDLNDSQVKYIIERVNAWNTMKDSIRNWL